jgi:glycosyltransferase involved in cell wall biosynthesis
MERRRVISGLTFFPRGGSAHVARALARELPAYGWDVTVLSGSRADLGAAGSARRFYRGLDVRAVSFDAALAARDPYAPPRGSAPLQGSYEDRPGAPDRVYASLSDIEYERQVGAWTRALRATGAHDADVLHLHHLTPLHEAARRVAPDVPVVGHLHGTELLMLEAIEEGARWRYGAAWRERMRAWAQRCERVLLLSESQRERAERLLEIDPDECIVLPNGFDPATFAPRRVDRAATWRRTLVEEPRGWAPGGTAGSIRYAPRDLGALQRGIVAVAVGRFTAVKRLPLLIEAFTRVRSRLSRPAALVLVGGHPGEWEGEHPAQTIARLGARDVFLAGWHDHHELSELLNAADLQVLASVREQFGQVLVEGMACGLPAIAVNRFGPGEIIEDGETGWLVEPDDVSGLADALAHAIADDAERERRGATAEAAAAQRFAWPAIAGRLAEVLDEVAASRPLAGLS